MRHVLSQALEISKILLADRRVDLTIKNWRDFTAKELALNEGFSDILALMP